MKETNNPITRESISQEDDISPIDLMNPYDLISRVFLTWLSPLMKLGTTKILEENDIHVLPKELKSNLLLEQTINLWNEEIKKAKETKKNVYIEYILLKLYGKGLIIAVTFTIPFVIVTLVQPYFIEALMKAVSGQEFNFIGLTDGIQVAVLLGVISTIAIIFFNQAAYNNSYVGVKIRTAVINLIFDKALKLSIASKSLHRSGEIMTLISADPERLWQSIIVSTWLFIGPINVILAMSLLLYEVGLSALVSLGTMILVITIQAKASLSIGKVRNQLVKFTDERTKIIGEVLLGIRVVKMYSWEEAVSDRIASIRSKEMELIAKLQFWKALNNIFQYIGPLLISFSLFVCYVATGQKLTVPFVYKISAILNIFRMPLWLTPIGWANLSEALISLRRINKFLLLEEINDITIKPTVLNENNDNAIEMKNCNFYWDSSSSLSSEKLPNLRNISLKIPTNSLTAIIGRVGSGKSSLISAILGEMYQADGERLFNTNNVKRAYCSQEHFILNVSLVENVFFDIEKTAKNNLQIDNDRYEKALDCSQLSQDLLQLPFADFTAIGERGINLSGGQKSRVSISRAIYNKSNLYIFDDTLSSVDMHVSKAIFNSAVLTLLKDTTRIFVLSSNYHLLSQFDNIIVMSDGMITTTGTFDEIVKDHPEYLNYSSKNENSNINNDKNSDSDSNSNSNNEVIVTDDTVTNVVSFNSIRDDIEKKRQANILMTKEDREEGNVKLSTYLSYFSSSSQTNFGIIRVFIIVLVFLVSTLVRLIADLWIGLWPQYTSSNTNHNGNSSFSILNGHSNQWFFNGYIVILIITIVGVFYRSWFFISVCLSSSKYLHDNVLRAVLKAPINIYFDVTPIGRILNRFSKDLDSIDSLLPDFFLQTLQNGFQIIAVIIACIASSSWFIIVLFPIFYLFYRIQRYFRCSSREIKRIEGMSRSPLYVMFNEVLQGLTTIRAYEKTKNFKNAFFLKSDKQAAVFFYFYLAQRWLAIRLDMLSNLILFVVAILTVGISKVGAVDPNLLGLALVNSIQLSSLLQWTVRITIDTENNMTSVERLLAFLNIPREQDILNQNQNQNNETKSEYTQIADDQDFGDFAVKGSIVFKNLKMRYRPNLDLSLRGIDLSIPSGTKVGLVGRTGSGKSSLALTLFRVVEIEDDSAILVDGYNLKDVPLSIIRSKITIIPQDPLMLSGTLRSNLDPFNQYTDEQLWQALERSHLKSDIMLKFPDKLMHEISERGENISQGQKQLVCIARAILRQSQIIVMDEATSNIDSETDAKIQATVRTEFSNCTVLTIAHRLETIIDYDIIAFMDNGIIKEKGSPLELLQKEDGHFRSLVESLGTERQQNILKTAKNKQ